MIASEAFPRCRSSHLRRHGPICAMRWRRFSLGHRPLRSGKGLLRGVGRIDPRPVQGTKIVTLLAPGDDGIGVGGITAAPREACNALAEVGLEEKSMEGHAEDFGGYRRRSAFLRRREHRVDDRRVAGRDRAVEPAT